MTLKATQPITLLINMSTDKLVAQTVRTQLSLYRYYITKLVERRDRYASDSLDWALQHVHVTTTLEKIEMLTAMTEGKTVQPS